VVGEWELGRGRGGGNVVCWGGLVDAGIFNLENGAREEEMNFKCISCMLLRWNHPREEAA
jgi:hypothetical protein